MTSDQDLQTLEERAYQSAFSDGIIDLFVGLSLVWIGIAWIWIEDLAGLAGVFPAVFAGVAFGARKQFVESRLGYVRWSEPRRQRERRNTLFVFLAGVVMLAGGVGAAMGFRPGNIIDRAAPGIIAWLLALMIGGLALITNIGRMWMYALAMVVGGVAAAALEANPGWPLLAAGAVVTATGAFLLTRFVRAHPAPAE